VTERFRGSYTVSVSPFIEDGAHVDIPALEGFIDWQLDVGVPGIIALGSTGEFLAISELERDLIVTTYVERINGRIPVLIGTMNAHTPNAVKNSMKAEDMGADGLMILPPYYYTPTDDEVMRYYEAIDDVVSIPVMLYNNPVTSNIDMSAKLVGRLAKTFESVQYIKESSQELGRVTDVIEEVDGHLEVYAGERVVDSCILGAIGYVNPYGNYIPVPSYRIFDLVAEGRIDEARQVQRLIDRIDHIIAAGHPTYGHQCYSKALAAAVGHPVGDVREPLTTFSQLGQEGRDRVGRILPIIEEVEALVASMTFSE
jgi:4-hydroxy-tetrahydrodipicolinate synthase